MPNVLIIDDNAAFCELLRDALVMNGYDVDVASSRVEALEAVQRSPPDAVLLDLQVAETDGETLATELAAAGNQAPIILLSGSAHLAAAARRMQAAGFLSKPFQLPNLVGLLSRTAQG